MLSIRLSLIEIAEDDVVVAVESEADDADESFLLDFFSFWVERKIGKSFLIDRRVMFFHYYKCNVELERERERELRKH